MRPCSAPGRTVSSTASVTPGQLDRERRGRRDRVGDHRVVVAAHVVHARAELRVRVEEGLVLLLGAAVGEVALHDDRVGIERLDLADRAGVHHVG